MRLGGVWILPDLHNSDDMQIFRLYFELFRDLYRTIRPLYVHTYTWADCTWPLDMDTLYTRHCHSFQYIHGYSLIYKHGHSLQYIHGYSLIMNMTTPYTGHGCSLY
jgi:hypothetical protein